MTRAADTAQLAGIYSSPIPTITVIGNTFSNYYTTLNITNFASYTNFTNTNSTVLNINFGGYTAYVRDQYANGFVTFYISNTALLALNSAGSANLVVSVSNSTGYYFESPTATLTLTANNPTAPAGTKYIRITNSNLRNQADFGIGEFSAWTGVGATGTSISATAISNLNNANVAYGSSKAIDANTNTTWWGFPGPVVGNNSTTYYWQANLASNSNILSIKLNSWINFVGNTDISTANYMPATFEVWLSPTGVFGAEKTVYPVSWAAATFTNSSSFGQSPFIINF
jgi:hypothetical protein